MYNDGFPFCTYSLLLKVALLSSVSNTYCMPPKFFRFNREPPKKDPELLQDAHQFLDDLSARFNAELYGELDPPEYVDGYNERLRAFQVAMMADDVASFPNPGEIYSDMLFGSMKVHLQGISDKAKEANAGPPDVPYFNTASAIINIILYGKYLLDGIMTEQIVEPHAADAAAVAQRFTQIFGGEQLTTYLDTLTQLVELSLETEH
ncbi:MAG: hypothetical protein JWM81_969 [Candidatus Saccharibacteria bacterium]|nr:hypothetical protein [Candidatus Saccharibacteria bacterium]